MLRREFLVGGVAAWALTAHAQQTAPVRRIGVFLFSKEDRTIINPFIEGLEALGYGIGKDTVIEFRDAGGKSERFAEVAQEIVRLTPHVIFCFGGDIAEPIKDATRTIPIVVVVSNDPVEARLVGSLARPGGNITGLTQVHDTLAGKSIELLKDTIPSVSRVAILWNPDHADPEYRETKHASHSLGVELQSLEVRQAGDFEGAFRAAERDRAEALIVIGGRLMFINRYRVREFAEKNRIVLLGVPGWLMPMGALMTYGPNLAELHRRAATYVDKILKGAKPADLPIERPTTFELQINMSVAKRLGIAVPPTLIARADKTIE
jgi:ABC-type uncharacterized transport system substrate-binding protein